MTSVIDRITARRKQRTVLVGLGYMTTQVVGKFSFMHDDTMGTPLESGCDPLDINELGNSALTSYLHNIVHHRLVNHVTLTVHNDSHLPKFRRVDIDILLYECSKHDRDKFEAFQTHENLEFYDALAKLGL